MYACLLFAWQSTAAQVKLPRLLTDGMVLQRNTPLPIWGWAGPGETVTVKFDGEKVETVTGGDGEWSVLLKPRKAGGPYILEVDGINHVRVKDILIGDVWICTGQSNMALPMEKLKEKYPALLAQGANPSLRQFSVAPRSNLNGPEHDLSSGRWESADPASLHRFTATGYFFAKALFEKYHVPIGLLNVSKDSASIQSWLSPRAAQAMSAAGPVAAQPTSPVADGGSFNAMIAPLLLFPIRGAICYQGESDTAKPEQYRTLFAALIADWRAQWKQGNFPFLYVQLANHQAVQEQPSESKWAELREAQRLSLSVPATAMAVTLDIGDANDIHPLDKEDVGKRLALAAEKLVFGDRWVVPVGPLYESFHVSGKEIHLRFSNIGEGLAAKGGGELRSFAICGADHQFRWAKAKISGDKVIVWNEEITHPVAVRYAWADNPEGANLYNQSNNKIWLPASPFSTEKK